MAGRNAVEIILSASDRASGVIRETFGTLTESNNRAMSLIKVGAGIAAGAMATLGGFVAKTGVDYNAMAEQSQVAWTTLLGSQEKAKTMLQDIANFAKSTPFETEQVDTMAKYMNNAGFAGKALFDQLMKISDVASAFNIPADSAQELARQMSQVVQAGVAYTEDLNILGDRGVPIYQALSKELNTSVANVKKMASEGKITSDIYMAAFSNIAKGVKGASDAQSQTFSGLISTLTDNLKMISGELSKPLFNLMKKGLDELMPVMDKFLTGLKAGGVAGGITALFPPGVVTTINQVQNAIKGVFSIFNGHAAEGNGMLMAMGFSFDTVRQIDSIINTIKSNITQFFGVYLTIAKTEFEGIKGVFLGAWQFIKGIFSGDNSVAESFKKIFNTAKSIVMPILTDIINFVKEKFAMIKQFWDENGAQIIQAVKNFFAVLAAIFQVLAPVILFIIKMVWDAVAGVIDGALKIIMGLIKIFAGLFTGDFGKMWEGIKQVFFGAIEFIWNWINLMMFGRILSGIKGFFTESIGWFKNLWAETVNVFKGMGDGAWSMAVSMFTRVRGVFSSILEEGRTIFNALKDAITNPIQTAKDVVGGIIEGIKSFFRNIVTHIPMPHFKISGSLNPMKWGDNPPSLGVDWYDKGGVFYGPQVIGVGEKRPEFVGALDDLTAIVKGAMSDTVASAVGTAILQTSQNNKQTGDIVLNLDGRTFARIVKPWLDMENKRVGADVRLQSI